MGLIDDVRKKRDSWAKRFEEHRQEEEGAHENLDPAEEEKRIKENLKRVGVFEAAGKKNEV
jgi:hypothetical protein